MPQNTLEKPKNKVLTKDDIDLKEKSDTFWMQRVFKWVSLFLVLALLVFVTYLYLKELTINNELKNQLMKNITENMHFILVSILSIFGFKIYKS